MSVFSPAPIPRPALLFIFGTVWASMISFGLVGLYPGDYNIDPHIAINFARYFIHRADHFGPLVDMYTHGFVHPLIYLPFVYLMEILRIPYSMQDCIAIGIVYGLTMGLIGVSTYFVSRYFHGKFLSSLISLVVIASILVHPSNIDFRSPNAELIGSVFLLFFWCILLYRDRMTHATLMAVFIGVLVFHLKYQLLPQLFCLSFISGLKLRRATYLALLIPLISLLVDMVAYRFANGYGFFGRISLLTNDYVMTSNPEFSRGSKTYTAIFANILTYYPLFLVAWSIMLHRILKLFNKSGLRSALSLPELRQSLLLSVVTIASILLPGKNYPHYYILLLPTTVYVLNKALASEAYLPMNRQLSSHSNPLAGKPKPRVILISILPFLFFSLMLCGVSFVTKGNSNFDAPSLMTKSERSMGAHFYGWGSGTVYGSYGTHPVNPSLDLALMSTKFSMNLDPYNRMMANSDQRPEWIIDVTTVGRNEILGKLIKPIEELKGLPGSEWADSYQLVRENSSGRLYKLSGSKFTLPRGVSASGPGPTDAATTD